MDIPTEIERFKSDWDIDFGKKRISRKPRSWLRAVADFIWPPKCPVIALYRFAQLHLSTEAGIVFPNFVDRNKGSEVAGVPSWFQLSEDWEISENDLSELFLGPLVKGESVLVPALPKNGILVTIWNIIGAIATIGGAVGFLVLLVGWVL